MRTPRPWPGTWSNLGPQVVDHRQEGELAWLVRGYPFTHAVLARSNVAVKYLGPTSLQAGPVIACNYGQVVRVELMAEGFHDVDATPYGWFADLEWLGPLSLHRRRSAPDSSPTEGV